MVVPQPNAVWAVDVMSDTLYGGRRFRTLNILDEGVREGLAIEVDTSLLAERVVRVLEQVVAWRGSRRRFASTMDRSSSLSAPSPGVQSGRSRCGIFNRGNRIRMPSSSAIIGPIEPKGSMPMCLSHWSRCERSPQNGCGVTTKNGPMTHWQVSHPPRIGLNLKPEVLL